MGLGGRLDYLVDNVFNYPTLAECYKIAALDASNKLSGEVGSTPLSVPGRLSPRVAAARSPRSVQPRGRRQVAATREEDGLVTGPVYRPGAGRLRAHE